MKQFSEVLIINDDKTAVLNIDSTKCSKEHSEELAKQIPKNLKELTLRTECRDLMHLCLALDDDLTINVESHVPFNEYFDKMPFGAMFAAWLNMINTYTDLSTSPHTDFDVQASIENCKLIKK